MSVKRENNNMKNFYVLFLILISNLNVNAQASWNTKFAFILRDENNNAINLDSFKESYKLVNVYGDTVSNNNLIHYLTYDEKTKYFILDIETIGPSFSFALIHKNELMVIYLPFPNPTNMYYAVDFKFRIGEFLFCFDIKDQEKIYFNSNSPYYTIKKINWKRQNKKLKRSSYSNDKTYHST